MFVDAVAIVAIIGEEPRGGPLSKSDLHRRQADHVTDRRLGGGRHAGPA